VIGGPLCQSGHCSDLNSVIQSLPGHGTPVVLDRYLLGGDGRGTTAFQQQHGSAPGCINGPTDQYPLRIGIPFP